MDNDNTPKFTVYVGNLNYGITDEQLQEHFAAAGNVLSAKVIMDKFSGRSKGFGFVDFETDEERQKAVEMFDGQEFEGRPLKVNEARPQAPRTGGFQGNGGAE